MLVELLQIQLWPVQRVFLKGLTPHSTQVFFVAHVHLNFLLEPENLLVQLEARAAHKTVHENHGHPAVEIPVDLNEQTQNFQVQGSSACFKP